MPNLEVTLAFVPAVAGKYAQVLVPIAIGRYTSTKQNLASVYIIFSKKLNKYYTGSCLDLNARLNEHNSGKFTNSFTSSAKDWVLFYSINDLNERTAREIEGHIKSMKSRVYIQNLARHPEISQKLMEKYTSKD